jgi:Family of unknown function (DUF5908)
MPVEIREMIVKAYVPAHGSTAKGAEAKSALPANSLATDEIVAQCVAAVMKILEKRERR